MKNGMDLYMHNSIWPKKNWALYKLHNVNDLALWHTGGSPNKKNQKNDDDFQQTKYHTKTNTQNETMKTQNAKQILKTI